MYFSNSRKIYQKYLTNIKEWQSLENQMVATFVTGVWTINCFNACSIKEPVSNSNSNWLHVVKKHTIRNQDNRKYDKANSPQDMSENQKWEINQDTLIFQMLFKLTLPLFLQKSLHFLPSSCPEFYLSTFPKFKIFLFFCYLVVMLSQFIFVNTTIHLVLSM